MFDATVKFEDVSSETLQEEQYMDTVNHYENLREELGYQSIWSMTEFRNAGLDKTIVKSAARVRYQFVRPDATSEELFQDLQDGGQRSMSEVTSLAVTGTIGDLWRAAESCIKQSGTHHRYIEDFEYQDDGSLLLITGS